MLILLSAQIQRQWWNFYISSLGGLKKETFLISQAQIHQAAFEVLFVNMINELAEDKALASNGRGIAYSCSSNVHFSLFVQMSTFALLEHLVYKIIELKLFKQIMASQQRYAIIFNDLFAGTRAISLIYSRFVNKMHGNTSENVYILTLT